MIRTITLAAALMLGATCLAQAQSERSPGASPSPEAAKTAPQNPAAMGAPALSKSKAEERLAKDGYSDLQLRDDTGGGWSGTAMRNGAKEDLHVGFDGAVTKR
ncbi:MAG: hypothetical protein JWL84_6329 [Rhodospirillales bacterium]|jgi:hypothetical protein|nr:hypothetical protein [Rhodospirillales bacterium]